jgi:hypothetical protein
VVGYETHSFLDEYSRVPRYAPNFNCKRTFAKTTFVVDWDTIIWVVMPFYVNNGSPTYQCVVSKTFENISTTS